jgi:hypothetical protein
MQYGMAMHADDVDPRFWMGCDKLLNRFSVKASQLAFDHCNRTYATENRSQPFAKPLLVRDRQRGPGNHTLLTIGLDHRNVDAVERSTAHQAERVPQPRGVLWPGLNAYVR